MRSNGSARLGQGLFDSQNFPVQIARMSIWATNIHEKLQLIEGSCEKALYNSLGEMPTIPGRDVEVLIPRYHPDKKPISTKEGQARILHDLASIELQAMELALRTLSDFQDAPKGFREELVDLTLSESRHLKLCLDGMEKLGFQWGTYPVHTILWEAVKAEDSLLDRILIVHRYMEGSGLDAGDTLVRRLNGVQDSVIHGIAKTIFTEEIGHVEFGSRWYREICRIEGLDPAEDYPKRMDKLRQQIPKRIENICRPPRRLAGFTEQEMDYLEELRASMVKFRARN